MDTSLRIGRINLLAGILGMLAAALGGMALGMTFDQYAVRGGDHVLSLARFYLREGHSHGMPIALFNLLLASLVDRMAASDRVKRVCAWSGVAAFLLPLGLAAKGAAGAPAQFPPLGLLGVIGLLICLGSLLGGFLRGRKD
ncbi:MAG: hypothetical protein HY823_04725 [Acidobacteria bacterium]|nr:hypothetical protein [Acidobacteriota bacterium]